jgi:carboxymethylenebutenolidase
MLGLKTNRYQGIRMTPSAIKKLWAKHTHCEFELRDAEATMETMVEHPYVMNIPTMVGGNGYTEVYHFYRDHFIPDLPDDYDITILSCTVNQERLVEEQILRFVHTKPITFMLPNIPPTGKIICIPLVVVVAVQDKKIASEHIYWDQASVLKQIGWITEQAWPVSGAEQATTLKPQTHPHDQPINAIP